MALQWRFWPGHVSITAEPLSNANMLESMLIGAVGGVIVVASITFLDKIKVDDPVGAISVHGTCGIWGLLAVLAITSADATLVGQLTGLRIRSLDSHSSRRLSYG